MLKLKKGGKMMEIMDLLNDIEDIIYSARADVVKFDEGNNAAGARVRKAMQTVKTQAQEVRVTVTEIKNKRKEN